MNNITINALDNSEVEIEGEISIEQFDIYHKRATNKLKKDFTAPGFRKGTVPEKVFLDKVGEDAVLHVAAEEALKDYYPKIILDNKIDAIGQPEILITKLAKGNPLGFKIKTSVLPKFSLPDYKKIAKTIVSKKESPAEVTKKDIDDAIDELRQQKEMEMFSTKKTQVDAKEEPTKESKILIDDTFAKSLGEFKNLDDLKEKLTIGIKQKNEQKEKDKRRSLILDTLAENTRFTIPVILIKNEKARMLADLRFQIERSGLDFSKYLSHISKTEEELTEGWKDEAEKRAKINLILEKIIKEESIVPDSNKVDDEIEAIERIYPSVPVDKARAYAESILSLEQVYSLLENPEQK